MTDNEKRVSELRLQSAKIHAEIQELDKKIKKDKQKLYNSLIGRCYSCTNVKDFRTDYFKILCFSLDKEDKRFVVLSIYPEDLKKEEYSLEHDIRNLDSFLEPDHFGLHFWSFGCDSLSTNISSPSKNQTVKEITSEEFDSHLKDTMTDLYNATHFFDY